MKLRTSETLQSLNRQSMSRNLQCVCLHDSKSKVREQQSNPWHLGWKINRPFNFKSSLNSQIISQFTLAQDFSGGLTVKGP